jgi:SAM-dependent methyltransferase
MNDSLLTVLLRCPGCGSDLSRRADALFCINNHSFPYRDNVIDFSAAQAVNSIQERSKKSFQIEWTRYYPDLGWTPQRLPDEIDIFLTYTRAMPSFFCDGIVIDAGCGNGRYINVVNKISSPPPQLIIGVEISDSIFVAAKNCLIFDNVLFIKMDLNLLPKVLKKPVDYIYSVGVLHHTPDAEKAFYNLAKCVKKNGFFSMFLYGKGNPIQYRVNRFLRNRFFQKWPHWLVYCLCVLVAIPCQIFRIKFFGPWMSDFVTRFVFVSADVPNMFDAYTAGWTSFHEKQEVEQWYRNIGFDCVVEARLNYTSLFCIGRAIDLEARSKSLPSLKAPHENLLAEKVC